MSIEATSVDSTTAAPDVTTTDSPAPFAVTPEGQGNEAADPWAAHAPPAIKPQSARERILARETARRTQAEQAPLMEQLRQEQQRSAQLTQQQQHAESEFRRLLDAGDINAALKVKGIDRSFSDIQRQLLIAKGVESQSTDPRVDQIQQQLEQERNQRYQWEQQQQQQRQQQHAQQQWAEDAASVKSELAALGAPDAQVFSELPGVAESVLKTLVSNPSLTTEQAAYMVRQNYMELAKAFQAWNISPPPAEPVGQTPSGLAPRRGAGATPLKAVPEGMPRAERFKQLLKLHGVR